ncbi:MAG: diacylglycerol kinase family lipid kinase [Ruminococcaceae bacterium]|nr:diacylglycerol kinase family lipid kinase [Oscillospiraceae bacterium]
MRYSYIINPIAGQRDNLEKNIKSIEEHFCGSDDEYEIYVTEYPKHAKIIANEIAKSGEKARICAVGGDGTLNEVVSGIVGYDNVEVGVYPDGSGNDFIKMFGERKDFRDVGYIRSAKTHEVDLIGINDDYCINIFSLGLDADIASDIPRFRRLIPALGGKFAYTMSIVKNLFKKLGKRIRIDIDGEKMELNCLLMAVANGKIYGGGYCAAPEADVDDGLLDVITVKNIPKFKIASVISKYKKGEHIVKSAVADKFKGIVEYRKARNVLIESKEKIIINLDGESMFADSVNVRVIPKKIKFLIPHVCGC